MDTRDSLSEDLNVRSQAIEKPARAQSGFLGALRYLDLPLLLGVLGLTCFGLWSLHGTVHLSSYLASAVDRQVTWLGISLCVMALVLVTDYRWLGRVAPVAYILNLGLLVLVLIAGREINGAKSWFRFGPISFQPAETMKVITVIMLAEWYAVRPEGVRSLRDLIAPALLCGVPMALVLKQPDLGTASLFGIIFLTMLYWSGVRRWIFAGLIATGVLCAAGVYPFLKDYQKARIMTFIDPTRDPKGAGYNVLQSMIAVGSGGVTGQGWGEGSQAVHRYLPEAHTDFIFASTVEQTGLAGTVLLLGLYGLVFWRILRSVGQARDRFGGLVIIGLGAILMGHVFMNICMNIGLFPVTGLPLPFMSYGGSFLLAMYVMVGLILNVGMRRFLFNK